MRRAKEAAYKVDASLVRGIVWLLATTLAGCNGIDDDNGALQGNLAATDNVPLAPSPTMSPATTPKPLTDVQTSNVCKAGIAILMGRDPKTMKATPLRDELTRIEYRRPNDRKLWKSECRIEGDRVITRGVDQFGNDGPGRWRDGLNDEVITFKIVGASVTVHDDYGDGSSDERTYRF